MHKVMHSALMVLGLIAVASVVYLFTNIVQGLRVS